MTWTSIWCARFSHRQYHFPPRCSELCTSINHVYWISSIWSKWNAAARRKRDDYVPKNAWKRSQEFLSFLVEVSTRKTFFVLSCLPEWKRLVWCLSCYKQSRTYSCVLFFRCSYIQSPSTKINASSMELVCTEVRLHWIFILSFNREINEREQQILWSSFLMRIARSITTNETKKQRKKERCSAGGDEFLFFMTGRKRMGFIADEHVWTSRFWDTLFHKWCSKDDVIVSFR